MRRAAVLMGVLVLGLATTGVAWAGAIQVPADGASYGDVANWGVTWGGTGIPTTFSAYREITDNNGTPNDTTDDYTIRIAMRAHGRYQYQETADSSGPIYYVETGKYPGTNYAKWNFAFYVAVLNTNGQLVTSGGPEYWVELLYDFDPGANTEVDQHGKVSWSYFYGQANQDSWNLAMSFLSNQSYVTPPSSTFNPNVNGEYTFRLAVYRNAKMVGGPVSIKVNAVPEPTSLIGLGGLGLVGAGWRVIRRRKSQSV